MKLNLNTIETADLNAIMGIIKRHGKSFWYSWKQQIPCTTLNQRTK